MHAPATSRIPASTIFKRARSLVPSVRQGLLFRGHRLIARAGFACDAAVPQGRALYGHAPLPQTIAYLLATRLLQAAVLNAQRLRRTGRTDARAAIGLKCAVIHAIRD